MKDAFDGKLILSYQSRILVTDSLVKIVYSYWPTFTGQKMDGSKATSNIKLSPPPSWTSFSRMGISITSLNTY